NSDDEGRVGTQRQQMCKYRLSDVIQNRALLGQLCESKFGSLHVQKLLENEKTGNWENVELFVYVLCRKGVLLEMSQDKYANYVVQKVLELFCENAQWYPGHTRKESLAKSILLKLVKGHVEKLATNAFSCRILQKIFKYPSKYMAIKLEIVNEIMGRPDRFQVFLLHHLGHINE
ncbi:pumilio family RNA-binding protein, partial [Reticulomyxa filosa]